MNKTYEKSCKGKNFYHTKKFAKNIARTANRTEENEHYKVRPYRCDFCGGWHIGHMRLGRRA